MRPSQSVHTKKERRRYTKSSKKCETCIYKNIQTLRKNQENFHYIVIYKNPDTLFYAIFHEFLSWNLYTKSLTLFVTWIFYIQKAWHLAKIMTMYVTFYIQKSGHFPSRSFSLNFWNWCSGGDIFIFKKCILCYICICKKQCILCYVFIYKNPDTFPHIFINKKHYTLRYVFMSKIYYIVLIPNYKHTYNQSNCIKK